MGLWWKISDVKAPDEGCVIFEGDQKAFSKRWCPILWRFQHNWAQLKIAFDVPYTLFFEGNGVVMEYKTTLETDVVFVRIGPKPVKFWAYGIDGMAAEVTFGGRWIQAPLRQGALPGRLYRGAPHFYKQNYPFI